jgi:hypothetical protein
MMPRYLQAVLAAVVGMTLLGSAASVKMADAQSGSGGCGSTNKCAQGQRWIGDWPNGATGVYANKYISSSVAQPYNGLFAAAPLGLTDYGTKFIESGPINACNGGTCGYYPYASFAFRNTGVSGFQIAWGMPLTAGSLYSYQTLRTPDYYGNTWYPMVYWGNAWQNLSALFGFTAIDMGINALNFVSSGAENDCISCPIGWGYGNYHQVAQGQPPTQQFWNYWCWNYPNIQPPGSATIYPCDAAYGWTAGG